MCMTYYNYLYSISYQKKDSACFVSIHIVSCDLDRISIHSKVEKITSIERECIPHSEHVRPCCNKRCVYKCSGVNIHFNISTTYTDGYVMPPAVRRHGCSIRRWRYVPIEHVSSC